MKSRDVSKTVLNVKSSNTAGRRSQNQSKSNVEEVDGSKPPLRPRKHLISLSQLNEHYTTTARSPVNQSILNVGVLSKALLNVKNKGKSGSSSLNSQSKLNLEVVDGSRISLTPKNTWTPKVSQVIIPSIASQFTSKSHIPVTPNDKDSKRRQWTLFSQSRNKDRSNRFCLAKEELSPYNNKSQSNSQYRSPSSKTQNEPRASKCPCKRNKKTEADGSRRKTTKTLDSSSRTGCFCCRCCCCRRTKNKHKLVEKPKETNNTQFKEVVPPEAFIESVFAEIEREDITQEKKRGATDANDPNFKDSTMGAAFMSNIYKRSFPPSDQEKTSKTTTIYDEKEEEISQVPTKRYRHFDPTKQTLVKFPMRPVLDRLEWETDTEQRKNSCELFEENEYEERLATLFPDIRRRGRVCLCCPNICTWLSSWIFGTKRTRPSGSTSVGSISSVIEGSILASEDSLRHCRRRHYHINRYKHVTTGHRLQMNITETNDLLAKLYPTMNTETRKDVVYGVKHTTSSTASLLKPPSCKRKPLPTPATSSRPRRSSCPPVKPASVAASNQSVRKQSLSVKNDGKQLDKVKITGKWDKGFKENETKDSTKSLGTVAKTNGTNSTNVTQATKKAPGKPATPKTIRNKPTLEPIMEQGSKPNPIPLNQSRSFKHSLTNHFRRISDPLLIRFGKSRTEQSSSQNKSVPKNKNNSNSLQNSDRERLKSSNDHSRRFFNFGKQNKR